MINKYYLKDVLRQSDKKLFTHISTFSGGGGSTIGIKLAGGHTLLANEFVEEAVATYKDNFDTPVILGDIKELTGQDFLDKAGIKKGELDLLEGSPPCSAFSACGSIVQNIEKEETPISLFDIPDDYLSDEDNRTTDEKMGWNKTKTYSDGKKVENIEDLFFEFIRIADEIQPRVIIAENVEGLTKGESKKYLNRILNAFGDIGYTVTYKVLNALDYGVAQSRKRVIFLAIRNDVAKDKNIDQFNIGHIYPDAVSEKTTLKTIIGDIQDGDIWHHGEEEWANKLMNTNYFSGFAPMVDDIIELQKTKKDKEYKICDVLSKRKYFSYYVLSLNSYCPTLTQKGMQNGCYIIASEKYHHRPISILESIRIMGLPEDYKLTGKPKQKYERIGRMVSPPMYFHLCRNIYKMVLQDA